MSCNCTLPHCCNCCRCNYYGSGGWGGTYTTPAWPTPSILDDKATLEEAIKKLKELLEKHK